MARYTIELRNVCMLFGRETVEGWFKEWNLSDYLTDEEIAIITARGVFDKDKLASLIVDHYFMNEIGFETPALFRHYAKVKMHEIMEEKAPLLYTMALAFDPLKNVNYTETLNRRNDTTTSSSSNTTSTGSGLSVNSDTPQGQISKASILAGSYASQTSANEDTNSVTDSTSATGAGVENYTKTIQGVYGKTTVQEAIRDYRKNIISLNYDIIKELNTLFMGVY
jgi:hypothetical protein